MSLVDTAVVGRSASSLELAALGPATMVGDSLSYLFSFLSVATTNLIATSLASEEKPPIYFERLFTSRSRSTHVI